MMKTIYLAVLSLCLPLFALSQTHFRDDAGQGGIGSGFYESLNPINFPSGASGWWHLLDVRHSNTANNFAMQLAGSFFDQNFYLRKTNNFSSQAWARVVTETDGKVGIGTTAPQSPLHVVGNGFFDGNVRIIAKDGGWVEGLSIIKPTGWSGLRLARNDPSTGNFEGNWAMGYSAYSGNDFTISNQSGGIQHDWLFHIRSDNQFVGIGTANPVTKLHVVGGDIKTGNPWDNSGVQLGSEATERPRIGFHASDNSRRFKVEMNDINTANERLAFFSTGGGAYNNEVEHFSVNKWGRVDVISTGAPVDGNAQFNGEGLLVKARTATRSQNAGAQIEFVIPANSDGSNFWGQARIIAVAGNNDNSDATGKLILGTRRMTNKLNTGNSWYYGDDLVIDGHGSVGIGILAPSEKLSVNGKIRAREIRVDALGMPDYVFEPDYRYLSLPELEQYIKLNRHLPEVPSAIEAEEKGVELGEMNKLLLKKVEELTLHLIEKDKQILVLQKGQEEMANLLKMVLGKLERMDLSKNNH